MAKSRARRLPMGPGRTFIGSVVGFQSRQKSLNLSAASGSCAECSCDRSNVAGHFGPQCYDPLACRRKGRDEARHKTPGKSSVLNANVLLDKNLSVFL